MESLKPYRLGDWWIFHYIDGEEYFIAHREEFTLRSTTKDDIERQVNRAMRLADAFSSGYDNVVDDEYLDCPYEDRVKSFRLGGMGLRRGVTMLKAESMYITSRNDLTIAYNHEGYHSEWEYNLVESVRSNYEVEIYVKVEEETFIYSTEQFDTFAEAVVRYEELHQNPCPINFDHARILQYIDGYTYELTKTRENK